MTALAELGLSSYEEQVYRTLLVTGAATASTVSEASDVPRGRIYDILNGLEARQLVRTRATDPTEYAAVAPDEAVTELLAERAAELHAEWARYRRVADTVRSTLLPSVPADANIWLGGLGSAEMETALQEHVRTATSSVHAVVGPPYGSAPWETLRREVTAFFDGTDPDVSVSLVVSEDVLDTLPASVFDTIETGRPETDLRAVPELPVSFDVLDRTVATVDIPHPRTASDRLGVLAVQDSEVVAAFERQFRALWADAVPVVCHGSI
ncbi:TrmB family transcriptional regulator [Haloarcula pelagica]|uniref:TrmB family transcriptional regulator n=1 Tax=Haloarcula pelagica TaxID=3033389 RepID=UPI0024C24E42|nr:helix-turn-helix domain-containing protein [Halomicroarcula sp. YJ-61-S]